MTAAEDRTPPTDARAPGDPDGAEGRTVLVVDNYDSFVWTIVGYLQHLGARTIVRRNDAVDVDVREVDGVLISPGPGTPAQAGASIGAVRDCAEHRVPLLGVCLGHQVLAEVHGATVSHAPQLMHGKTSLLEHRGTGVFAGLPAPLEVTRYHSLSVEPDTVPDELEVTSWVTGSDGGLVMGLRHRDLPLEGVQFHPESVLTQGGHRMIGNWLQDQVGVAGAAARGEGLAPRVRR